MVLYLAPGAARLRKNEKKNEKKILLEAPRACADTQKYEGCTRALSGSIKANLKALLRRY
jgi:hypothetical protein